MVAIYHNPRCSKSRQALDLLRKRGVEPEIVEYLKTPPDKAELKRILKLLGVKPRALMRKSEAVYKEKRLDNPALTDDQLIAAMVADPVLIERPIVLAGGKAALGRPRAQAARTPGRTSHAVSRLFRRTLPSVRRASRRSRASRDRRPPSWSARPAKKS